MPRGNDSEAALHELADRLGSGAGTAEQLIQGNAARYSKELRQVSLLPVDREATDALDLDKLSGPDGEAVVSAGVHSGDRVSGTLIAYRTEDGRLHKGLVDYDDGTQKSSKSKSSRSSAKTEAKGEGE